MSAMTWLLAWSLAVPHAPPPSAHAQTTGCSAPRPEARRIVSNLVSGPDREGTRARLKIPPAHEADVTALVGRKNAATCDRLLAATLERIAGRELHGLSPSFYEVGDYYYVVLTRKPAPPGHVRTGFTPLYVIDRRFVVVRALAQ